MKNPVLAVIAKQPTVGTTKTRLSPPLSLAAAAGLFEALLFDTFDLASSLAGIDLAVAVTPPDSIPYFERTAPPGARLLPVSCPDIGDCLRQVFEQLFHLGYPRVLAFNADGPSLPRQYFQQALQLLAEHDVVYGPSEDGGYYLVGLKEHQPRLFQGIEWSTSGVLSRSLAVAGQANLAAALLPPWYDVDTAADLRRLLLETRTFPTRQLIHSRRFFAGLSPQLIHEIEAWE